ncbi:MAG: SdpI family protein [Clostridiales bacterium]|nr:SdpI family protein [Clostridiales bacterium]
MNYFQLFLMLLIPLCLSLFGLKWKNNPPKVMGSAIGYRSRRSLYSPQSWEYAHRFMGRIWSVEGPLVTIVSLALYLYLNSAMPDKIMNIMTIIMLIQPALFFIPIIFVEQALEQKFPGSGKKRKRR